MAFDASSSVPLAAMASVQAFLGFDGFAAYAMFKGGINGLTRQVASECAGRGIRCNAMAPGSIASPMNDKLRAEMDDPDVYDRLVMQLTPIGRQGTPEDIGAMAVFLAEPELSGFLTRQVIRVDGGATIRGPDGRVPATHRSG